MSWQAASMLLLAFALIGGAVWYERSRPRPQVIALVAAMAALAAAGRVVFSPIPNVVPTTDLAVFSGYALGGAPGFMVGALSALVSNLWLGQGPWTPWQMAGWGLAGSFGAGLAVVTGRRMGRVGFAVACGLMGLLYGALLDYSAMVVFGGEQSLERYLALSVRGIPFNLAHAAGNFAIALVAGPAIVGLLERHRRRFTHRWEKASARRAGAAILIIALCLSVGIVGSSDEAQAGDSLPSHQTERRVKAGMGAALDWLERNQNRDGGFGFAPGRASDPATTGWVALGIAAAGRDPISMRGESGSSPIGFLRRRAGSIRTTGDIERTILALAAAGKRVDRFGGVDLAKRLRARVEADGSLGGQVNLTAFYLLATVALGGKPHLRSVDWLKRSQGASGGWGYGPGVSPDADSTGAALQALEALGVGSAAAQRGSKWLRRNQARSGGWGLPGSAANAQSTAWAVQGLIAAGGTPGKSRRGGVSPLDYLAARQSRDGHYRYSAASDQTPVWVTGQVLAAVAGEAFPIAAVGNPRASSSGETEGTDRRSKSSAARSDDGAASGAQSTETGTNGTEGTPTAPAGTTVTSEDSTTTGSGGVFRAWWLIPAAIAILVGAVWLGIRIRSTLRS